MKNFFWMLLILCSSLHAQCFDCIKNFGGFARDIDKLPDGFVHLYTGAIHKYDFNCNLLWTKTLRGHEAYINSVTTDPAGNIYLMLLDRTSTNAGMGPWNVNGFMMSPGVNFYKLNPNGDVLWWKHIGPMTGHRLSNIAYSQNALYLTGTFYQNLTFSSAVSFNHPYTDYPRAFIAKYDTDGNFIAAAERGNGLELFGISEIDPQGNTYLTYKTPNYEYSRVDKIDANLNLAWSTTLTSNIPGSNNPSVYDPTGIRFNSENQKLYLWGGMNLTTNILGHSFFISENNGVFQSALTEFNASTGTLTNIRRFDNNSNYSVPVFNGPAVHRSAFMAEKNGDLYLLTSFSGTLPLANGVATSTTYNNNTSNSEDLLLLKIKLFDFTPELVFQSYGVQNLNYHVGNHPGKIMFNGDDLYLTASFSSNPMTINGAVINNNSGNNNTDAMLYKYNILNSAGSGVINAQQTCLNDQTVFNLSGTYDSVVWNFGEPASPSNVSTLANPQHQYLSSGTYHVKAVVTCGIHTQTVEKDVVITPMPYLNAVPPITACEDSNGSGISSSFDTTQLQNRLVGAQPNVSLSFFTSSGLPLPSPLTNPFTNTVVNSQTVVARAYFTQNPGCYIERPIVFTTLASPLEPTAVSQQTFCIQENALIRDLTVAESNVIWHDAPFLGNSMAAGTALVNGNTYYASLKSATCESKRVPVTVLIQATPAPTGVANQLFCAFGNPTLSDIIVSGNNLKWYRSIGGSVLALSTRLTDGMTYYATQTVDGCESMTHLSVTVQVQSTLNVRAIALFYCDDDYDGLERINLDSFQHRLIDNPEQYHFSFFDTEVAAEDGTGEISAAYELRIGMHSVFARITSSTGCFQIVEIELELNESPQLNIPETIALCKDLGTVPIHAGDFDHYLWSTGEMSASITVSQPGSYWVTVTEDHNNINCSTTKNFEIFLSDAPQIERVQVTEWTAERNSIVIVVDTEGSYEYSIDGFTFQESNTFENLLSGTYNVYVRDVYRCDITKAEVVLLMYPVYFTPNGDGYNDVWKLPNSKREGNMSITIFDRYGKRVCEMSGDKGWDGTYNGKNLPTDDYWFVITHPDGKKLQGHFALKR